MRLSELFDYLNYGELSQLSIGGNDQGVLDLSNQAAVITHINLGLVELYKRFPIKLREVTVQQIEYLTTYHLDARYALSNPHNTDNGSFPKYIIDSPFEPFTDDVLLIEAISDEACEWYTLNDESDCRTIITNGAASINTPDPASEAALFIHYRAAPEKISVSVADPSATVVPITDQYIEPLLNYVAYRAFAAFNMNNPETVGYYQKFEASCALLDQKGMRHKDAIANSRLGLNGWL